MFDIFLIFAQNIDCGYMLEPPCRGGSNEYPQSMFLSKNKKNRYTPAYPILYKSGLRGYTLHGHVFVMGKNVANGIVKIMNEGSNFYGCVIVVRSYLHGTLGVYEYPCLSYIVCLLNFKSASLSNRTCMDKLGYMDFRR